MLSEININLSKKILYIFLGVLIISITLAIFFQLPLILLAPVFVLASIITISDLKLLYFLIFFSIPLSIHIYIGNLGLDILTEPLLIVTMLLSPFIFLTRHREVNFLTHPIILFLIVQFVWAVFTSFFSVDPVVSIKFMLAKAWFIIPIVFLGGIFIKELSDVKKIFWMFFIPLIFTCLYTSFQHFKHGFNFEMASWVMKPFFLNHVIYSTTIAIFIPFVWYARYWYAKHSQPRIILNWGLGILLFAILVSYTRASWLAILALIPCYYLIKWRLTKTSLIISAIGISAAILYLNYQNKYLDYGFEFQKVVYHQGDIEGHLAATYKMQDVSGVERLYRWVAAKNLIMENWLLGCGPNTFFPEYKKYTVNLFTTYVSDNPERSTTHNYFLMLFTEQGFIGFFLFTAMYVFLLLRGAKLSILLTDKNERNLALAVTLSLFMLTLHLFLNDLIETDKIGLLFYLNCLLLLKLDQWKKKGVSQEITQDR